MAAFSIFSIVNLSPLLCKALPPTATTMRCGGTDGVASSLNKRTVRLVLLARRASILLYLLSLANWLFSLCNLLALQRCLQTGMVRVLQATTGRVCTASPAALKWLKREQLLKLLKSRTRQSSCRGGDGVERYERPDFQTRSATQRVSAKEAQRHCKHPLCDGALRTGCPPCVA